MAKKSAKKPVAAKARARPTRTSRPRAAGGAITVRMYNVGFGDAFLVVIPTQDGDKRILFDCGSIAAGPRKMADVAQSIVDDCTLGGQAAIDVVVCTHRHKDHVSGFAKAVWNEVAVKEVWMPWTEHPTDAMARTIREAQGKVGLALTAALFRGGASLAALAENIDGPAVRLEPVSELTLNALSNSEAMSTLHSGFRGSAVRRFLPDAQLEDGRSFSTPVLPGVKIHVLGPSKSEEVIRDMEPAAGESYLRMRREATKLPGDTCRPFSDEFEEATSSVFDEDLLKPEEIDRIASGPSASDLEVAVALDKAVNGTSLMLVLEVRGKYLLFPGDAQWGTWMAALADPIWRELLAKTDFYKIGHHGSHNATPPDFVEDVLHDKIFAMASTLTRPQWDDIPREPLLTALAKKAQIARSDREGNAKAPFTVVKKNYIEISVPI